MPYFSVDVPDEVREFLGACARTNSLNLRDILNADLFPVLKQTWEQWADKQDHDLYNNGSFMCAGVNVHTDIPFFCIGLRHAVWNDYCEQIVDAVAQAIAHNELHVLEEAVWENVTWEHAEQRSGKGRYTNLTVDGSAFHALIHSIPRSVLGNILFRCHSHAVVQSSNVHVWLEEQQALRERMALTQVLDISPKTAASKKM